MIKPAMDTPWDNSFGASIDSGLSLMRSGRAILVALFLLAPPGVVSALFGREIPTRSPGNIDFESSNLPIITIQTNGLDIPDDPRITAEMAVIHNGRGMRNHVDDPATDFEGRISIETRGAISRKFPKKSYALETQDADGNNANVSLLGLPVENDWILYAPYSDKTLMRNVLAYDLARKTGHYASRTRYCELLLNDEYMGIYVLTEKIKIDNDRVDISVLNPDDIDGDQLTGGYIIRGDRAEEGSWESLQGKSFQYHHPQADRLQPEQKDYIRGFITDFEKMLAGADFADQATGYRALLDVEATIDYFIVQEVGKNVDGFRFSVYMYKDRDSRDGRLHLGPVWDFNIAFGNMWEDHWGTPYRWARHNNLVPSNFFWWDRLMEEESFVIAFQQRWRELRSTTLNPVTLHVIIDSIAHVLDEAQQRNFERWPILSQQIWPNPRILHSYKAEVDFLKDWLTARIEWLDDNMPNVATPATDPVPEFQGEITAYPNPFSNSVGFFFKVPTSGTVEITIYDLLGREVQSLAHRDYPEGTYAASWGGHDSRGRELPSGLYLYDFRLQGKTVAAGKIVKIKR